MSLILLTTLLRKTTEMQIFCSGVDGIKVQLWKAIRYALPDTNIGTWTTGPHWEGVALVITVLCQKGGTLPLTLAGTRHFAILQGTGLMRLPSRLAPEWAMQSSDSKTSVLLVTRRSRWHPSLRSWVNRWPLGSGQWPKIGQNATSPITSYLSKLESLFNPRPTGGGGYFDPPLVFLRYLLKQFRYHHKTCSTLSPNNFTHCVKILKSRVS